MQTETKRGKKMSRKDGGKEGSLGKSVHRIMGVSRRV